MTSSTRATLGLHWLRRRLLWSAVLLLVCLGGAGLTTAVDRPATQEARPELSWTADRNAEPWFEQMLASLQRLDLDVAALSGSARRVLIDLNSLETTELELNLAAGDAFAERLLEDVSEAIEQRETPPAGVEIWRLGEGNLGLLERIDRALVSAAELPTTWQDVALHGRRAAELLRTLQRHDEAALAGIRAGRDARWREALVELESALADLEQAAALGDAFGLDPSATVLDQLIADQRRHDEALLELYSHLTAGGSLEDAEGMALRGTVEQVRQPLPTPELRLQSIMAEVGGSAISSALSDIEEVRGNILDALDEPESEEGEG